MKKRICLAILLGGSLLPMVPTAVAQVVVHKPGHTVVHHGYRVAAGGAGGQGIPLLERRVALPQAPSSVAVEAPVPALLLEAQLAQPTRRHR
jgi:hypothetical protein